MLEHTVGRVVDTIHQPTVFMRMHEGRTGAGVSDPPRWSYALASDQRPMKNSGLRALDAVGLYSGNGSTVVALDIAHQRSYSKHGTCGERRRGRTEASDAPMLMKT